METKNKNVAGGWGKIKCCRGVKPKIKMLQFVSVKKIIEMYGGVCEMFQGLLF